MTRLSIQTFDIEGPALITPVRHGDARGWFQETWNANDWAHLGLPEMDWKQDNEAFSEEIGTLRGLHFQRPPNAQAKLIRVIGGGVLDVAVDIRASSPTYGKALAVELNTENGAQLYVPPGFAHGYQTLRKNTRVAYKCDQLYAPEAEGGLLWSDAELAIDWPLPEAVVMNGRDFNLPTLAKLDSPF